MNDVYDWNRIRDEVDGVRPTNNLETLLQNIARAVITIAEAQEIQTSVMLEAGEEFEDE